MCHARVIDPYHERFANVVANRFISNARQPCFTAWRNTDVPIGFERARVPTRIARRRSACRLAVIDQAVEEIVSSARAFARATNSQV
ncbi:hypothetical protein WS62_06010 [Burkholderia sp. ABCPW 14]|nr:hypothetical protein WS62_06010 [Burkholderia sp. ABCPW 14]